MHIYQDIHTPHVVTYAKFTEMCATFTSQVQGFIQRGDALGLPPLPKEKKIDGNIISIMNVDGHYRNIKHA